MKGRRNTKQAPASTGEFISDKAPEWLSEHARTVWKETIDALEADERQLSRLSLQAFTGFCDAAGLVRECAEVLAREGMTIDGGREGLKRHPAVTTRISALNALRAYSIELGLTPGTSKRIPKPEKKEHNPFDDF